MEPLQAMAMPAKGVLVGLTRANSWQRELGDGVVLLAYIATNSTERLSFVSLQSAARAQDVRGVASRPSGFEDMAFGVVVEVYLARGLGDGQTVYLSVAQAGAGIYYPPQPIDDLG